MTVLASTTTLLCGDGFWGPTVWESFWLGVVVWLLYLLSALIFTILQFKIVCRSVIINRPSSNLVVSHKKKYIINRKFNYFSRNTGFIFDHISLVHGYSRLWNIIFISFDKINPIFTEKNLIIQYLLYTYKWNTEKYWWSKMRFFIFLIFTAVKHFPYFHWCLAGLLDASSSDYDIYYHIFQSPIDLIIVKK
jgi:hypothetical protein